MTLIEMLRANGSWEADAAASKLQSQSDRIQKLEAALREILSLGEWGANPLARTVAMEALGTTYEQLKEGA
jgi:hypothetical protein